MLNGILNGVKLVCTTVLLWFTPPPRRPAAAGQTLSLFEYDQIIVPTANLKPFGFDAKVSGTVAPGSNVSAFVDIDNLGKTTAVSPKYAIIVSSSASSLVSPQTLYTGTLPNISAGSYRQATVSFNLPANMTGQKYFWLVADPNNAIKETIETDNRRVDATPVTVAAPAPAAPGNLQVAFSGSARSLSFNSSITAGDYFVERSVNGGGFMQIAILPASQTSHTDSSGQAPGTALQYRVKAVTNNVSSPWAVSATVTVPQPSGTSLNPFPANTVTSIHSTSPFATTSNAFYVTNNGQNLVGQCSWGSYARVVELVASGHLDASVRTLMENAFWGKSGRDAKNWDTLLGGTWTATAGAPLPVDLRVPGMLAIWEGGSFGHVGFVEEISADKTQYRLSDFNRDNALGYRNQWYSFSGGSDALLGSYPKFRPLAMPGGVTPPTPGVTALANNTPVHNLGGGHGSETLFKFTVPPNQSKVEFRTNGGAGDVDQYIKLGSAPTTTSYDRFLDQGGNNELITIDNPAPGEYFIMLRGWSAYSGVTLTATITAPAAPSLDLSSTALGGYSHAFAWNDLANESSYKIWYQINNWEWASYTAAANSTSSSWTLSPGLTFKMKITALDAFGNVIATSNTVSLTT